MRKRINTLLILIAFSLSCLPVFAADTVIDNPNKYGGFTEICSFFKELGIINKDKDYNPDDLITRAEYTQLINRIVNRKGLVSTAYMPVFTDVDAEHPYSSDIMGLYNMGYIVGYIDGNNNMFNPDAEIEFYDALHILLEALGYGNYAKFNGGYIVGDYAVAKSVDISISDASSECERIFSLVSQALETKMLDIVSISHNHIEYDNLNSDTMLERFFDIKSGEGVLESDGITSLSRTIEPIDGEVIIGGTRFSITFDYTFVAGTLIKYYYKEDSDGNTELVYLKEANKSKIITYNASEIDKFENMTYSIWKNEKRHKVSLKQGVTIVYNGKVVTEFDESKMKPADGYISFIDNDGDGKYDVVHIMEYIGFVVKSIVESDDYITIYADSKLNIKPIRIQTKQEVRNLIYGPKGLTGTNKIQPGVIVSAFCNNETTYQLCQHIYISNTIITGNIERVAKSDGILRYTVNGDVYNVVNTYANSVNSLKTPLNSVMIYVNHEGKIAGINLKESSDMSLGYLLDAKLADESFDSPVLYIKAFCEIGKVVTYKVADKVIVDGITIKSNSGSTIVDMLKNSVGDIENQLFRYSVNSNKEINKLDLYEAITSASEELANNNLFKVLPQTSLYYKKNSKSFSNKVKIDENTMVFVIPNDTKTAKDTEYSITNSDWLESDGRYYVEAYSMSVNSVISDVVIVKYNLNDLPLDYHPSIVKDVFECINSDGERTAGITVENEQSERTLIAVTSDIVNKAKSINSSDLNEYQVEKGDVIKYALNTLGEISAVQVIYKYSTDAILSTLTASSSTVFNNGRVVKGYIYNVENDFISVAFEDLSGYASDHVVQASDCEIYNSSEFKIICVYERNGKLYFDDGYISNLKSFRNNGNASKVIVYTDNGNGKFMIVLE